MVFTANHKPEKTPSPSPSLPSKGEAVKKLEFAPSPYPLPAGERVNFLKLIINFLPLDGGGAGWG